MALDIERLKSQLCERLCTDVGIHERSDGVLMLDTPFTFPDGDQYPIYVSFTPAGGIRLSDRGHTMMHISYDHDIDVFSDGVRATLREQIVRESGIEEEGGVFSVETRPDELAESLFRFGQTLTKIYDLTFLSRDRVSSTFYEDLGNLLTSILDEKPFESDYIATSVPDSKNYPVDFHFAGRDELPVFLYGVPNQNKARLATIMLSHFLLHKLEFESIIVFANQQTIPRLDLARLTNVAGTAVASLDAAADLRRKVERLTAA